MTSLTYLQREIKFETIATQSNPVQWPSLDVHTFHRDVTEPTPPPSFPTNWWQWRCANPQTRNYLEVVAPRSASSSRHEWDADISFRTAMFEHHNCFLLWVNGTPFFTLFLARRFVRQFVRAFAEVWVRMMGFQVMCDPVFVQRCQFQFLQMISEKWYEWFERIHESTCKIFKILNLNWMFIWQSSFFMEEFLNKNHHST